MKFGSDSAIKIKVWFVFGFALKLHNSVQHLNLDFNPTLKVFKADKN